MSDYEIRAHYHLNTPLDCQIKVRGHVSQEWESYFEMHIICAMSSNGIPFSILTGRVIDQAALLGILNKLYGFGLPLLYVACCPCADEAGSPAETPIG